MRTLFTFTCNDFNTSEPKDFFINPGCFGDDVARWMIEGFQKQGLNVIGKPKQEDFGWYFTFVVGNISHDFVIGFRPGEGNTEGNWVGWIERRRGFIGSLIRGRKHGIQPSAIQTIHTVFSASPQIKNLLWHFQADFDSGREGFGTYNPWGDLGSGGDLGSERH